LRSFSCF